MLFVWKIVDPEYTWLKKVTPQWGSGNLRLKNVSSKMETCQVKMKTQKTNNSKTQLCILRKNSGDTDGIVLEII